MVDIYSIIKIFENFYLVGIGIGIGAIITHFSEHYIAPIFTHHLDSRALKITHNQRIVETMIEKFHGYIENHWKR